MLPLLSSVSAEMVGRAVLQVILSASCSHSPCVVIATCNGNLYNKLNSGAHWYYNNWLLLPTDIQIHDVQFRESIIWTGLVDFT